MYLERRGSSYNWRLVPVGLSDSAAPAAGAEPDVWMTLSTAWPFDEPDRLAAFFADLIAELESMAGGADRCRWPLDEPWPHGH
ncbi:hypothetical protein DVS77_04670 [Mycolicibacterium moriokaense]|nr:hypothetical protein DVS77_04670 [Mycolicibacterium moriokaense]